MYVERRRACSPGAAATASVARTCCESNKRTSRCQRSRGRRWRTRRRDHADTIAGAVARKDHDAPSTLTATRAGRARGDVAIDGSSPMEWAARRNAMVIGGGQRAIDFTPEPLEIGGRPIALRARGRPARLSAQGTTTARWREGANEGRSRPPASDGQPSTATHSGTRTTRRKPARRVKSTAHRGLQGGQAGLAQAERRHERAACGHPTLSETVAAQA